MSGCTHSLNDPLERCCFCTERVPVPLHWANLRAAYLRDEAELIEALAARATVMVTRTHLGVSCWICWTPSGDAVCRRCGCGVRAEGGCTCEEPEYGPCVELIIGGHP